MIPTDSVVPNHPAVLGAIVALHLEALDMTAADLAELIGPFRRASRVLPEVLAGTCLPDPVSWTVLGDRLSVGGRQDWQAALGDPAAALALRDELVARRARHAGAEAAWRAFYAAPSTRAALERVTSAVPEAPPGEGPGLFVVVDGGYPTERGSTPAEAWRRAVESMTRTVDVVAEVPEDPEGWADDLVDGLVMLRIGGPLDLAESLFRQAAGIREGA